MRQNGGRGESHVYLRDEQNQPIGDGIVTTESNFDYVTIPVQWAQRFGKKVKYQFGVGFYASFLIKSELVVSAFPGFVDSKENRTDLSRRLDMGLIASFSISLPIKESISVKLVLDDNLGLLNISDVTVADNGTIKNNSLGLTIGLAVKLK